MPSFTVRIAYRFLPNRCGKETIKFVNINKYTSLKWSPQIDFVKINLQGKFVEILSCSLVGYLKCAQPCGRYRRTRRDASDSKYETLIRTAFTF